MRGVVAAAGLLDEDVDLVEAGDVGMGAGADGEEIIGRQLGAGAEEDFDAALESGRKGGAGGRRDLGVAAEGSGKGKGGE